MERDLSLISTKEIAENKSELTFLINGQNALTCKQLFSIERLYKNWKNWKIKLAVWLINKTKL